MKLLEKYFGGPLDFKELKDYPDEVFQRLVEAAIKVLGDISSDDFQRLITPDLFRFLVEKFPDIPKKYTNLLSFLKGIEEIHYSIPGAFREIKKISVIELDNKNRTVTMRYKSLNKLDTMFINLILCAAKYYGENVDIAVISKMSDGADSTVVKVKII